MCDTVIAGLRWNFVALNVCICKEEEEKKINDMSFYLKKLGGKKEINPKSTKGNKKQKLMTWKTIHIIEI